MANAPQPPVYSSVDKNGGALSGIWQLWFNSVTAYIQKIVNYSGNPVQVPLTGFSITIGDSSTVLTLNPAGTLATGTIIMPAHPYDGMPVEIASTQIITALTLSPNTGQSIKNAPSALAAGVGIGYYYVSSLSTWFRRY